MHGLLTIFFFMWICWFSPWWIPHGNSGMFHPLVHQIPVEPGFFLGFLWIFMDLGQKKWDLIGFNGRRSWDIDDDLELDFYIENLGIQTSNKNLRCFDDFCVRNVDSWINKAMMNGDDVLNLGCFGRSQNPLCQGDDEWMKQREERGRLGTALLQPMAIYEVRRWEDGSHVQLLPGQKSPCPSCYPW